MHINTEVIRLKFFSLWSRIFSLKVPKPSPANVEDVPTFVKKTINKSRSQFTISHINVPSAL